MVPRCATIWCRKREQYQMRRWHRVQKGRQRRRKPASMSQVCELGPSKEKPQIKQCNLRCYPAVPEASVTAVSTSKPEPAPGEVPATHLAPPLLPEHMTLLAPFLSSNVDSGSWRATCRDAKQAIRPNGPYAAMLSPAGQAALVSLEKRKKLQKILVNARKLVAGL